MPERNRTLTWYYLTGAAMLFVTGVAIAVAGSVLVGLLFVLLGVGFAIWSLAR